MVNPTLLTTNYLFVPATMIERVQKAFEKGADSVVVDLEDAVSDDKKLQAWQNVWQYLAEKNAQKIWLRINSLSSDFFAEDSNQLKKLKNTAEFKNIVGFVLPKVNEKQDIEQVYQIVEKPIIALIESPLAMANIDKIASSHGLFAMSFGFLDICEQLNVNVESGAGEMLLNQLRYQLLIHSKINGLVAPIEGVFARYDELDLLQKRVKFCQDLGFSGIFCIHPKQVEVVQQVYQITDKQQEFAKRVITYYEKTGEAVFAIDGQMVDMPVIKQAYHILDLP